MAVCINCGKQLGLLGGNNEIIKGNGQIFCNKCFKSIEFYVNMLHFRSTLEGLTEAESLSITAIEKSNLSQQVKEQSINEIEKLYLKRCEDVTQSEEKKIEAENQPEKNTQIKDTPGIDWEDVSRFSHASGKNLPYVVIQVTLKEKLWGTGSGNLTDLEDVINAQVAKGYRLHTMSTANGGSKGLAGGDRIQATLVFERLDMR